MAATTTQAHASPWQSFNSDLERTLLSPNHSREEVFQLAKQRFERDGCVLIIKFRIDGDGHGNGDGPDDGHGDYRKLSIIMYLRSLLDQHGVLESSGSSGDGAAATADIEIDNDIGTNSDADVHIDRNTAGSRRLPSVVKYDDERIFCVHRSPSVALRAAVQTKLIVRHINQRFPEHDVQVSCGLDVGPLVLLVGDYYGNAVNIASKLGEDHATDGQILISDHCYRTILSEEKQQQQQQQANGATDDAHHNSNSNQHHPMTSILQVEDGFVRISKVEISFKSIDVDSRNASAFIVASKIPTTEAILEKASSAPSTAVAAATATNNNENGINIHQCCLQLSDPNKRKHETAKELLRERCEVTCTVLQSDMSGFTRLTQRYGIYHFLLLVANCRKIFRSACNENDSSGGKIIKYDGDNVIVRFATPHQCIQTVRKIRHGIRQYNMTQPDPDFQIRLKLGVAHGPITIIHHDIVGKVWEDCCLLGEDTAEVDEILVTKEIHDALQRNDTDNLHPRPYAFEKRTVKIGDDDDSDEVLEHYNLSIIDEGMTQDLGCSVVQNDNVVTQQPPVHVSPEKNQQTVLAAGILRFQQAVRDIVAGLQNAGATTTTTTPTASGTGTTP